MGIKTFSPEMAGIPEKHDLEKKMASSDVISHADVKEYADYIIGRLKALKNSSEEEKEAFVVDAFRGNRIFQKVAPELAKPNALDETEAQAAIKRVQRALLEELKGKIDDKIYLVIKNLRGNNLIKDLWWKNVRRNIVDQVIDVENDKENIYKDQESLLTKKHKKDLDEAMGLFRQLDPHPNIVNIKNYDSKKNTAIFEKLNLRPLSEYLSFGEKNKRKFFVSLKIAADCMAGASYLADNDLVLQDIKVSNLGVVLEKKNIKGVLFDLEGLVKKDTLLSGRIVVKGYLPPETSYASPEVIKDNGWKIKPGEMTYQFGVCLQKILDSYALDYVFKGPEEKVVEKLVNLINKMTAEDPESRITLAEAENELEEILSKLI